MNVLIKIWNRPQYTLKQFKNETISAHSIRSDEGLTLKTSAFESLHGGQFILSTQLMKPNYLQLLYSPPTQHHSFSRNLPIYLAFICVRVKLGQGNHIIIVASSLS